MKAVFLAVMIVALTVGAGHANSARSLFKQTRSLEQTNASQAFETMVALAQTGFAPAMDRVGYYHRHGIGTAKNLTRAHHWYVRAVAGGHPWSTASLARVEIDLGLGLAAFHRLRTAVRAGKPSTARLYAVAHIDRKLGSASDPETGRALLEALSREGDLRAARDLMLRINWSRLNGTVPKDIAAQVIDAGLAGDARFAEPALIYLSNRGDRQASTVSQRSALSAVPGIRAKILAPERIRLAAIRKPSHFWGQVEDVLGDTEGDAYARAATTAFWINKNAWVRVLQKELRSLGHYNGSINGLMTRRTIRAQNRFCKDRGIWADCATGPLTGKTVKAVALALQSVKAGA